MRERKEAMSEEYLLGALEDKIFDTVTSYVSKLPRDYTAVISGGFDSGLMAAITKPYHAYRMKFPYGTKFDESRYAEAISDHLHIPIREIVVTPENYKANFEDAVKVMGEPTPHFSLVPLYMMMKVMAEKGEKDVLSGEGPDEYLGGYARQIVFDEMAKLYEIPELRNYHDLIDRVLGVDRKFLGVKGSLIEKYRKTIGYKEPFDLTTKLPLQGAIGKMDMQLGHIEKMEQKMAEHFGLNFHYPYINEELAEFCYQLPDDLKIRDGVTKWGFKKIALKYLPAILADRTKIGGPVAPVNLLMGWQEEMGDFGKTKYLEAQKEILGI